MNYNGLKAWAALLTDKTSLSTHNWNPPPPSISRYAAERSNISMRKVRTGPGLLDF